MIYNFDGYTVNKYKVYKSTISQIKVVPYDPTVIQRIQSVNIDRIDRVDYRGGLWTYDIDTLMTYLVEFKRLESDKHTRRMNKIDEILKELKNGTA